MDVNPNFLVLLAALLILLAVAAALLAQRRPASRHLAYRFGPDHRRWSARRPLPQRAAAVQGRRTPH